MLDLIEGNFLKDVVITQFDKNFLPQKIYIWRNCKYKG